MLEPAPMMRLTAVLLARDERPVLEVLGRLGLVELVRLRAGPGAAPEGPPSAARPAPPWPALLERLARLRATLGLAERVAPPREGAPAELEGVVERAESRVRDWLGAREALLRRRAELARERAQLERWSGLGIPAGRIGAGPLAVLRLGRVAAGALDALTERVGTRCVLLPVAESGASRWVVVLGARTDSAALDEALRGAGFEEEALPRGDGTLEELSAAREREAAQVDADLSRLEDALRSAAQEWSAPFAAVASRARLEQRLEEARRCFPRTESTVVLEGWLPAADAPAVERCVAEAAGGRCVLERAQPAPEEEDEVPVLLRSSWLLRPFEALVAGFGLPRYRELSPAPFLAVSFLVMFGVMFGDVGHGAVLAVAGLCGLAAGRRRDVSLLLLLCGASGAAGGVVYGSYFGLDRLRGLALWRDPLEGDPLHFLALGVGVGVLTISLGVVLNACNQLRHGRLGTALLGPFGLAGLAFYWTGLALATGGVRGAPARWAGAAVLALSVVAWLAAGSAEEGHRRGRRAPHGDGGGFVRGVVEAFETALVYLANTVSFVRLSAYGMSHAALLLAVLVTARAAAHGGFGFVAVLVVGNAIAIVLEGIIASVQALRLEYYEFFGKFFSGAGRPFAPFRLDLSGGAP